MPDSSKPADWIREATALVARGAPADAARLAEAALAAAGTGDGLHILGLARLESGDAAGALTLLEAAALLAPGPRVAYNRAVARERAGRTADAVADLRRIVADAPDYVPAYRQLAGLLARTGDAAGAADLWGLLAVRAVEARAMTPAREALAALAGLGRSPRGWQRLANLLRIGGHEAEAEAVIALRLAERPGDIAALLIRTMARLTVVHTGEAEIEERRRAFAADLEAVEAQVAAAGPEERAEAAAVVGMAKPFFLAYQGRDDTALMARYGRIVSALMAALHPGSALPARPADRSRIRVGYATAYFTNHSVSKLFRTVVRDLDRARFEVIGYQFSTDEDATSRETTGWCDAHHAGEPDAERWRARILADAPDVLLYPEIGMHPTAVRLAAERLALVQAMAWGHPVTSGLPTVDLFLSSALMEPPEGDAHYTERLVRLPNLSIDYAPLPSDVPAMERAALGLRDEAVVYVCCQSLFKYLPRTDSVFVAIAAALPSAQFLFIGDDAQPPTRIFRARLKAAFARAGLDADAHVTLAGPVPQEGFPALLKAGDVYLDSIGWSGGNTTLEAVSCGLPVVTHPTGLMRGRHTAAILARMGLDDMIARSPAAFAAKAVSLADPTSRLVAAERVVVARSRLWHDRTPVRALEAVLEAAVAAARGG